MEPHGVLGLVVLSWLMMMMMMMIVDDGGGEDGVKPSISPEGRDGY